MKKYYLLSLISASLIGATCIQCTSPKQKSGENTLPQKSELFVSLPDYCPTPDGMAIAPNGDLILACPNFADITQPACLMRITKDGAVSKWLDDTFSQERINKAEEWMTNFKNGVTDNVVDPLVPYLLAMRYPNPMDEWNQGYRREYPVSIKGMDRPLQVTLPLSWNLSQNLQLGQNEFMSWRSESGTGQYVVALIETPTGATVDSIVAGLQKARPDCVTEKLPDSKIVRVYFPAKTDTENAVYYYAVPAGDQVFTVCGEVLRGKDEKTDALNQRLQAESNFFNAVASNIFVKPAS